MFHLEDQSWDDEDSRLFSQLERSARQEDRFGPCDDDCETTAPFLDILPEESNHENGSPLNFDARIESAAMMDQQIQYAFRLGLLA